MTVEKAASHDGTTAPAPQQPEKNEDTIRPMPKSVKERIGELPQVERLLAANLLDAVWVLDADTLTYDYISPSVERISGYKDTELIGSSINQRVSPASLDNALAILASERKRFEKGEKTIATLEVEMVHKNGDSYWVEIRAKFQREEKKPLKIVGVTRDITARKNAEVQHAIIIKKLRTALEEKEQLLEEVKMLRELLPICSGCKRIRDEKNRWWPLDAYVREHTRTDFTHTICPDCKDLFYEDL